MLRLATRTAIARGCALGSARYNAANSCTLTPLPMSLPSNLGKKLEIRRTFSSPDKNLLANYQCVHVFVSVKPGTEQDFLAASLANARESSKEPGIARFDIIKQDDDPTKFVLVEVYKNEEAPAAHKSTNHYLTWRNAVEHMMAEPRRAVKYNNLFPATVSGWDYGDGISLE